MGYNHAVFLPATSCSGPPFVGCWAPATAPRRTRSCVDIFFDSGDPVPYDEEGWLGLPGRTILGDFTESFIAPPGWWSRPAYEQQWLEAATRLIARNEPSAFVLDPPVVDSVG